MELWFHFKLKEVPPADLQVVFEKGMKVRIRSVEENTESNWDPRCNGQDAMIVSREDSGVP